MSWRVRLDRPAQSVDQRVKVSDWLAEFERPRVRRALPARRTRGRPTAVGTLPSGAKVLAMGDTAVTNDPVGGQGANMAARAARAYQEAIVERADRPFDEEFMHDAFARYWKHARHATRFNNDLLAPPPDPVMATLDSAQSVPEVAHRFAYLFDNPADYEDWLAIRKRRCSTSGRRQRGCSGLRDPRREQRQLFGGDRRSDIARSAMTGAPADGPRWPRWPRCAWPRCAWPRRRAGRAGGPGCAAPAQRGALPWRRCAALAVPGRIGPR